MCIFYTSPDSLKLIGFIRIQKKYLFFTNIMNISFYLYPASILAVCLMLVSNILNAQQERNPFAQNVLDEFTPKEAVFGKKAMVVTAHPEASRVGADVLRRGGNAIDAAVAVQFALAVVFPVAGNIGGGGLMVARFASGKTAALDFREAAPNEASRDMFLDSARNVIPLASTFGHRASGVPGVVDGMIQAHQKYGKLPWKTLVQPAINLARKGVVLTKREAAGLVYLGEFLPTYNPGKTYFVNKSAWKEGDTLVQEDLATTFERIRDKGRSGFYDGKTAELLVAEMRSGGGLISLSDLKQYRAKWRTPLVGGYRGYNLITMPPPSAGGVGLVQLLNILEKFPLGEWGWNSEKTAHCMIEAERRVFADRVEFLGDPDFTDIPMRGLLNPKYIASRMATFNPDKATPSSELTFGKDVRTYSGSDQTTHFSIVDASGNAVAITTTLNGAFGSKVVVGGAGFLLNNEMDDFSVKPGVPNMFGTIGSEANSIAPRKRMLSSMTPTIVERPVAANNASKTASKTASKKSAKNELFMVLGTPGGTTITTSVLQGILNVIDHKMTMQHAVNARRFHHQYVPDFVRIESGAFTSEIQRALESKGHSIKNNGPMGKLDCIMVLPDKRLEGAADPRGDDAAVGF
jgi:gamma-glutamyltranspeptidase / glutathione hydrolase